MPVTLSPSQAPWHILQVSDVLDEEFASALAESLPVFAWRPERSYLPWVRSASARQDQHNPRLTHGTVPLLRGYARFPLSAIARTGPSILKHLSAQTAHPEESTLVCTVPYFASVAECWPGPVVYWLTDLIAEYGSSRPFDVPALDRRMCAAANLVCPNSERIAEYLIDRADCDSSKIHIIPNATRAENIFPLAPRAPSPLPLDAPQQARPVAGVIGNLAGNMDWLWLAEVVAKTPEFTWLFVGPTTMPIPDGTQRQARDRVIHLRNSCFVGRKPYGDLARYARAFDVAVLPYLRCEPTFSGSSTRFYEHLAACRPMLATRGFHELTQKEPLLRLVDTPGEAVAALEEMRAAGFNDGLSEMRWRASLGATWQARSISMQRALDARLDTGHLARALAKSA